MKNGLTKEWRIRMKNMMHIGNDVEKIKEALPEITKALMEILNSSAGDEVKKKAMDIIGMNVEIKNVTITNCAFHAGEGLERKVYESTEEGEEQENCE